MITTIWSIADTSVTIVKGSKKRKKQKKCLSETPTLFDQVLNTMLSRTNITEVSIFHEITYLIIQTAFSNELFFSLRLCQRK